MKKINSMKNILILETCRDCAFCFIGDINEISDADMKQAVTDAINGIESENKKYSTYNKVIFTESYGYYFSNLNKNLPPFQVEHIIEHIIS